MARLHTKSQHETQHLSFNPLFSPCFLQVLTVWVRADDDDALDAAGHAAVEAYSRSSPQKSKAIKIDKVCVPYSNHQH